jgi:hypothetical protein
MLKTDHTEQAATPTRLPYEKPLLQAIDLLAEEVMGGACKTLQAPAGSCTAPVGTLSS